MSRHIFLVAIALAALAGCGADPQPQTATSATDKPAPERPATNVATVATSAPGPAASASNHLPHAAGDPAALLGGGAALDALPTRATTPGKPFDPNLRQSLMQVPPL